MLPVLFYDMGLQSMKWKVVANSCKIFCDNNPLCNKYCNNILVSLSHGGTNEYFILNGFMKLTNVTIRVNSIVSQFTN